MPNRQLLMFVGIGIVVIAVALSLTFYGTKGAHLSLQGKILKVRTLATDDNNSIAVLDFRVTNQATKQFFVVQDATVVVATADGKQVEGETVSRFDVNRVMAYYKMLGPKYNETLIMRDKIGEGQTIDRMVAATIPLAESELERRKSITLRLHDVDGPTFELTEVNKK